MKTKSIRRICAVALLASVRLFAHNPGSSGLQHAHPRFESVTTQYVLVDPATGEQITVKWEAEKACPDLQGTLPQRYTVTITRGKPDAIVLSLWTLGMQSAQHLNVIKSFSVPQVAMVPQNGATPAVPASTGSVRFAQTVNAALVALNPAQDNRVAPAGTKPDPADLSKIIVDDDRISLVELTGQGSFVFTVESYVGLRLAQTKWNGITCKDESGHDNEPPKNPPD